jgi:hypothetical protein
MSLQQYAHPRRTTPRKASSTQTHEAYAFGAPLKGVDVSQPLPGGDPQTAIRLQNLIPRVLGLQLRKGFTRWVSNMGTEIRSIMQYHPAIGGPKMFCANSDGDVFDVTLPLPAGDTPVPVLSVLTGVHLGEWTSLNYTTPAGVHYLLMVSPAGGYYVYDGTVFTEIVAGTAAMQIDGVDPKAFSYVTVFKNRLVFIEHETTRVWYLPVGQIAGVATEFDFGAMLPNGGEVVMLVNWTYDGGGGTGSSTGLSNKLVIIADQGDVLVYGGEDPDDATTFRVEGRWYIGRVPVGNRFASQYMQDVAIISERGLCFMSELMRGEGFFGNTQIASNINSELAVLVARTLDSKYWEIRLLPHEQLMILNVPDYNRENIQWAYEVNNKAFCNLKGLPMLTVETFDGRSFCGDTNGNIWWCFEGQSDGAVGTTPGQDLQGTCVTAFSSLGEGIRVKRFLMCRASFISSSAPGVQIRLNKEWNLGLPTGAPAYLAAGTNFWDQGVWDQAVWSGEGGTYEAWVGASGTGRYGSLALQVRGAADTIFIGWQAVVEPGGIL